MIKGRASRVQAWVIIGMLVMGINVFGPSRAEAIPMDYVTTAISGDLTGTFSHDATTSTFTNWDLVVSGVTFRSDDPDLTTIENHDNWLFQYKFPIGFSLNFFIYPPSTYNFFANPTFGVYTSGYGNYVSVPEPATILLLGSGLAGMALWRWKRVA